MTKVRRINRQSKIVAVRCPRPMLAQVLRVCRRSVMTRRAGRWELNGFVLAAVADKLQHMERSNRRQRRNHDK